MDLGINLWGADLVEYGKNLFPSQADIDYFAAKGFSHIRLPFEWESIQHDLNGPLDQDFLAQVRAVVEYAGSQGMDVVLDLHNYGKYGDQLIGSTEVPVSSFADLWARIAGEFAGDTNVKFGLMNEPQQATASEWLTSVNAAISAIRDAGATQQVMVPGTYWSGAWSWTSSDNAAVLGAPGAIVDPAHNFAFEVHQYLDDTSGQNEWVVSPTIGKERLEAITDWASINGAKLYLGEFGVADNPTALSALNDMLKFMSEHSDVWQSASYWVAGSANPTYMYSVEPELGVLDAPQMDVLEDFTGSKTLVTSLVDGETRHDVYVDDRQFPTMTDVISKDGDLISRVIFDANGNIRSSAVVDSEGAITVTTYPTPGQSFPYSSVVYDASHQRIAETIADASGAITVSHYEAGAHDPYQQDVYSPNGSLDYILHHTGEQHVYDVYLNGALSRVETFNGSWQLMTRDTYDAAGNLTQRQVDNADGSHEISSFSASSGKIVSTIEYSAAWQTTATVTFDAGGHPATRIEILAGGGKVVEYYAGTDAAVQTDTLTADGKLTSRVTVSADGKVSETFGLGGIAQPVERTETSLDGQISKIIKYNANGHIATVELTNPDGSHIINSYSPGDQEHATSSATYTGDVLVKLTEFDGVGKTISIASYNADGSSKVEYFDPTSEKLSQYEIYSASGALSERANFDSAGNILTKLHVSLNGSHIVEGFDETHQSSPAFVDTFDASWNLVNRTHLDDDGRISSIDVASAGGRNTVTSFAAGSDHVSSIETYVNWQLETRINYANDGRISDILTENADGSHTVKLFQSDFTGPAYIETYSAEWSLLSRATYDRSGNLTELLTEKATGGHEVKHFSDSAGHLETIDLFGSNWQLLSRTHFIDGGQVTVGDTPTIERVGYEGRTHSTQAPYEGVDAKTNSTASGNFLADSSDTLSFDNLRAASAPSVGHVNPPMIVFQQSDDVGMGSDYHTYEHYFDHIHAPETIPLHFDLA